MDLENVSAVPIRTNAPQGGCKPFHSHFQTFDFCLVYTLATGLHNCNDLAICENTFGSFECYCPDGYSTNDGGVTCHDKNECLNGEAECPDHSTCENTDGSYECKCDDGWKKPANGNNICKDINECKSEDTNSCPIEANCVNNDGSYECICSPEDIYETMIYDQPDGQSSTFCEFRNECYEGTHNCDELATCIDVSSIDPRFICECPSGSELRKTSAKKISGSGLFK